MNQDTACELISALKEFENKSLVFPQINGLLSEKAYTADKKHLFYVTINRKGAVKQLKYSYQKRYYNNIILVRIDFDERRGHTNPDGESIPTPHIHIYREGYEDKFAYPLKTVFPDLDENALDMIDLFGKFCDYCNIIRNWTIERPLW